MSRIPVCLLPILLVLVLPGIAAAQIAPPTERVLIPIAIIGEQPGAYGSRWTSELVAVNTSDRATFVLSNPGSGCVQPPCGTVRAGAVFRPQIDLRGNERGASVFVERGRASDLQFHLRVHDVSRQSLTWGTELPVVRETEARTSRISLVNVPADARFRQSLRVYDFDDDQHRQVRVRILPMPDLLGNQGPALVETTLTLHVTDRVFAPGYAEIGNLIAAFPQLAAVDRVRIDVEPLSEGLRFWAFVTVTNNETQHVTTITAR